MMKMYYFKDFVFRAEESTGEKRTSDIFIAMRLTLLFLALIFLVGAAFVEGRENIGAKAVLILIGACILTAAIITFVLKPAKNAPK